MRHQNIRKNMCLSQLLETNFGRQEACVAFHTIVMHSHKRSYRQKSLKARDKRSSLYGKMERFTTLKRFLGEISLSQNYVRSFVMTRLHEKVYEMIRYFVLSFIFAFYSELRFIAKTMNLFSGWRRRGKQQMFIKSQ